MTRPRQHPARTAHGGARKVRKLLEQGMAAHREGARGRAEKHYARALRLDPANGDALQLLGLIAFDDGRFERAEHLIGEAIRSNPQAALYHYNLGVVRRAAQDLAGALEALRRSLELDADNVRTLGEAVLACLSLGEAAEALGYAVRVLRLDVEHPRAQQWLEEALVRLPHEHPDPSVCALLQLCYSLPSVDPRILTLATARQLALRYGVRPDYAPVKDFALPAEARRDPLLLDFLAAGFNCVPEMELFLTDLRLYLLSAVSEEGAALDPVLPAALAMQCFNNEYVFAVREGEVPLLEGLRERFGAAIEAPRVDWAEIETLLPALAMYGPAHALPGARALAARALDEWPPAVRRIIGQQVVEPGAEAALRDAIPQAGTLADPVSRVVKATYERYPYPRWIHLPRVRRLQFRDRLRDLYPGAPPLPGRGPVRVLVAGCGTGKHPLELASRYADVEVTAIDLSRASLAYAARRAQLHGIDNVRFVCCDLLEVGDLGQRFDHIESVGVLHHLGDPEQGLRALQSVLNPGGTLKLGLYSEAAREDVNVVRRSFAGRETPPGDDEVRALRFAMLSGLQEGTRSRLLDFRDFFTLNECRDLLFHPQEHQFTVAGIRDLLARVALDFLGFEVKFSQGARYAERFPGAPADDLDNWATLEHESPRLFSGMYQFHVVSKDAAAATRAA